MLPNNDEGRKPCGLETGDGGSAGLTLGGGGGSAQTGDGGSAI